MTAARRDLVVEQGETWFAPSKDGAFVWTGMADITGCTIECQARQPATAAGSALFDLSIDSGVVVVGTAPPKWQLTLTPAQTAALAPGRYAYDVLVTDPSTTPDTVYKPMAGTIIVRAGVTR